MISASNPKVILFMSLFYRPFMDLTILSGFEYRDCVCSLLLLHSCLGINSSISVCASQARRLIEILNAL